MAIAWPSNPSVNQTFAVGARTYRWTGVAWSPLPGNSYYPGGPDVAVADGGTGASTAPDARTNLGAASAAASFITTAAESGLSGELVLGTGVVMSGLASARPAASLAGRLWFSTDTNGGTLYRDSGAAWVKVGPGLTETQSGARKWTFAELLAREVGADTWATGTDSLGVSVLQATSAVASGTTHSGSYSSLRLELEFSPADLGNPSVGDLIEYSAIVEYARIGSTYVGGGEPASYGSGHNVVDDYSGSTLSVWLGNFFTYNGMPVASPQYSFYAGTYLWRGDYKSLTSYREAYVDSSSLKPVVSFGPIWAEYRVTAKVVSFTTRIV